MFLIRRPSQSVIDRFLDDSRELPLSYSPIGIINGGTTLRNLDEEVVPIGRGKTDFDRARHALRRWKQFDMGWVAAFPRYTRVATGTDVAVLIRHLGFWSLNGCRVVYSVGGFDGEARFGFAHGTLTNHAEGGEELFEVFLDRQTEDVMYRIRGTSWPRAPLARLGVPVVRLLQARFRRDSAAAMRRAIRADSVER